MPKQSIYDVRMTEANREFESPWPDETHRRRPREDQAPHRRRAWTPMRGVHLDAPVTRTSSTAADGAHLGVAGKDGHVKIGAVRESGPFTQPHRRHPESTQ